MNRCGSLNFQNSIKNMYKAGFYSPISITVDLKFHKKKYGLLICCRIIMPSFDMIRCQESGLNIVGIHCIEFFTKKSRIFWNI